MGVKLTKRQFKAKLTNPRLFAAREKVHQLRKELVKINWKVYSKYIPVGMHRPGILHPQIELKLTNNNNWNNLTLPHIAKSSVVHIIENVFPKQPYITYNTEYLYDTINRFSVYITIV